MGRDRYGWTLTVVAVSAFMVTLDNTVTNAAVDTWTRYFGTSLSAISWVATSYILIFSCLMIAGGRLVDVYGTRLVFTIGMSTFTLASLGAGLSHELPQLIAFRVLQGSGAALALPATLVAVTVGRTDKQKSLGNLVYILTASVASAAGPGLGGVIIQSFGWQWLFLINVGPGLLAVALGLRVLDGQRQDSNEGVDLPAVLTSATMLFAITYGVHAGSHMGWTSPSALAVFALALMSLISFIVVEKWAPNPMITTEFFRNKAFSGGLAGQILWGVGFAGVLFYSNDFMQYVLSWSPAKAGSVFILPAVIIGALTPVGFYLSDRFGPKVPCTAGMAIMAFGLTAFSRLTISTTFVDMLPGIILVGVGSALVMPLGMVMLKTVAEERAGVAGGLLNVGREISAALGIVGLGAVLHALQKEGNAKGLDPKIALQQGSSAALLVGGMLVMVGAVICAFTLPGRAAPQPEKTTVTLPDRVPAYESTGPIPSLSSGAFPIIPDWWGSNQRAGIPSAWPPPPPHSPYEMTRS
ncbi:MFS transporter [Actinocorallia longicatena]|uniref:MFS transporter n=1 Tax=Actinocorallia longicatena TaxID=111803 RepID=A0ABP6QP58_9ACTN